MADAAHIELSVRVVNGDGTEPFRSSLTVSATDGTNASDVAAAWLDMMRQALVVTRLQRAATPEPDA